jgi:hypothetical protein
LIYAKKKIAALVLYFGLLHMVVADGWKAYELGNKSDGIASSNALAVIYQGESFNPPKAITARSGKNDHSTPEALLESLFWAVNTSNVDAYNALFAPGEMVNKFLGDPKYKWTKVALQRIINYGKYKILELQVTYSEQQTSYKFFPVRKEAGGYFASEKLIDTDAAYNFLDYYYAFSPVIGNPTEHELREVNFSEKGCVFITNNVAEAGGEGSGLIYRFHGMDFGTNTFLEKWPTREDQDLSTPAGTLASAIAALNAHDMERYSGLLDPLERTNLLRGGTALAVGRIWDEWMRANFDQEAKNPRPRKIRLIKEIVYTGDTVALIYESADKEFKPQKDVLYCRKCETGWHISHKMEEVPNLFPDYMGFSMYAETKMFPHFDPQ